jgi:hypothetical protein
MKSRARAEARLGEQSGKTEGHNVAKGAQVPNSSEQVFSASEDPPTVGRRGSDVSEKVTLRGRPWLQWQRGP